MIDFIGAGIIQNGGRRVNRFEDVESDFLVFQPHGLGPVAQFDEALEMQVLAFLIHELVHSDAIEPHDMDASDPRAG